MISFEHTDVVGWKHAIRGARNPLNSWGKSDSRSSNDGGVYENYSESIRIGPNDYDLMRRLRNAGTDHRKFMRMITVYVDITAPMYWWSEFDTYKVGTVANSTSKMHKMLAKPFEMNDFSFDKLPSYKNEVEQYIPDFDYDKEVWKEIAKTGYEVSDMGRIRRGDRILAGSYHSDGYIFITINGNQIPIHRFVANAFISNPENKPEVNHIDGNKLNNRADNLEWVSKKENQRHASHVLNKRVGKYHYDTNLSDEIVIDIYNKCKYTDMKYEEIARIYNVSKDTPAKIAQGYSWKYLNLEPINRKDKRIVGKNLKTGKEIEYDSVRFAVKDGFSAACISGCCKGNLKTHKGYSWSYKNSK